MVLFKKPRFVSQSHDAVQVLCGFGLACYTGFAYLVGG